MKDEKWEMENEVWIATRHLSPVPPRLSRPPSQRLYDLIKGSLNTVQASFIHVSDLDW
jgi:hypothetical protein